MLKPRDRETLRKYLLSSPNVKKLNPRLIAFLEQNFNDCVFINNALVSASIEQKLNLKSKIMNTFGRNFLQPIDKQDDRIATAKIHNNEKDARVAPEQNYINIVQQSGVMAAAGLSTALPDGASMRVNIERLDMQLIDNIIIVENLQAFDYWYLAALPTQLSSALSVYRGHDKTAKSVLQLLQKCAGKANIIAFMDYDPKGLNLALSLPGVTHILLPELAKLEPSMSQTANYLKQADYLRQLKHNPNWHKYQFVQHLLQYTLAIAQESMFAKNLPLTLVKL